MDGTYELRVLHSRIGGRRVRHKIRWIALPVAAAVAGFHSVSRAEKVARHSTDIDVRTFGVDAPDGTADANERELRKILRSVHRQPSLEEGQEGRSEDSEQPFRRGRVSNLSVDDQLLEGAIVS
jgi:hypothetical protein